MNAKNKVTAFSVMGGLFLLFLHLRLQYNLGSAFLGFRPEIAESAMEVRILLLMMLFATGLARIMQRAYECVTRNEPVGLVSDVVRPLGGFVNGFLLFAMIAITAMVNQFPVKHPFMDTQFNDGINVLLTIGYFCAVGRMCWLRWHSWSGSE